MKKFFKNNEEFICKNCGAFVSKHKNSSRDHCTECLYGLHVDINPGDRQNLCRSLLIPIGIRRFGQKEQIVYNCSKCSVRVYCIVAEDDNRDRIIELNSKVWN